MKEEEEESHGYWSCELVIVQKYLLMSDVVAHGDEICDQAVADKKFNGINGRKKP